MRRKRIKELEDRLKDLKEIEKEYKKENGKLQTLLTEFEKTGDHIPKID